MNGTLNWIDCVAAQHAETRIKPSPLDVESSGGWTTLHGELMFSFDAFELVTEVFKARSYFYVAKEDAPSDGKRWFSFPWLEVRGSHGLSCDEKTLTTPSVSIEISLAQEWVPPEVLSDPQDVPPQPFPTFRTVEHARLEGEHIGSGGFTTLKRYHFPDAFGTRTSTFDEDLVLALYTTIEVRHDGYTWATFGDSANDFAIRIPTWEICTSD